LIEETCSHHQIYQTFYTETLTLATKLNISKRSKAKMTKLACKNNPFEPVYITCILTHETL
jgi:hypothetical protein